MSQSSSRSMVQMKPSSSSLYRSTHWRKISVASSTDALAEDLGRVLNGPALAESDEGVQRLRQILPAGLALLRLHRPIDEVRPLLVGQAFPVLVERSGIHAKPSRGRIVIRSRDAITHVWQRFKRMLFSPLSFARQAKTDDLLAFPPHRQDACATETLHSPPKSVINMTITISTPRHPYAAGM